VTGQERSQVERAYGHTPQHAPQRHRSTEPLMTWRRPRLRLAGRVTLASAAALVLAVAGAKLADVLIPSTPLCILAVATWGVLLGGALHAYITRQVGR